MNRRKKIAVLSTAFVVLVLGGVIWQAIQIGQSGESPLAALFAPSNAAPNDAGAQQEPVTIVLREEAPTPEPTPTPSPVPTAAPTAVPQAVPERAASDHPPQADGATPPPVVPTTVPTPVPAPTFEPTSAPTPTARPQVVESTPEPTPEPEIAEISLDTYSVSILAGDAWRINILSAPSSLYNSGATWTSGNSAVVQLAGSDTSGVTITGVSAGSTTVTVYSRATGQSASCTVTVS